VGLGGCTLAATVFAQSAERPDPSANRYVVRRSNPEHIVVTAGGGAAHESPGVDAPTNLDERHEALEQFRLGNELLRRGQAPEAERLFTPLLSHPQLTLQEKQQIARLCDQIREKDVRRASAMKRLEGHSGLEQDPDLVLAQARQAIWMRNYDKAETLAQQAQRLGHSTYLPWSDTPAKVLKDVQTARRQVTMRQLASAGQNLTNQRVGTTRPTTEVAKPTDTTRPMMRIEPGPTESNDARARKTLELAHQAAEQGDSGRARQLLQEAETLNVAFPWWDEHTPEKIRLAITRAEQTAKTKPTDSRPAIVQATHIPPPDVQPTVRPELSTPASKDPRVLVAEARKHLESGRLEQAVEFAKQAQIIPHVRWGPLEESPERILNEVAKVRHQQNDEKAMELLADARKLLQENRFDEAERLTYLAEGLRREYPAWHRGERHDRLRAEIIEKRSQHTRPPLPPLPDPVVKPREPGKLKPGAQGAKPLLEPRRPESEIIARSQPRWVGPEEPDAERARPVPADIIARSEARQERLRSPQGIREASGPSLAARPGVDGAASDSPSSASRKSASECLAEARQLQKEGLLLEAAAHLEQARSLGGASAEVTEESLATMFAGLQKDATAQMLAFAAAVQTLTAQGYYTDAERYLKYMQQLSGTFQVDMKQAGEMGRQGDAIIQTSGASAVGDRGGELYAEAMRELRGGGFVKARRLAESLYSGPYQMRLQAKELLAKIDEAEFADEVRRTLAHFELGARAFLQQDYDGAALYLQNLDTRLLDKREQERVREILASRELQERVTHKANSPPVNVTVIVSTPGEPAVIVNDPLKRPGPSR
jgi:tetratricopeptide (TPR) repeat protein